MTAIVVILVVTMIAVMVMIMVAMKTTRRSDIHFPVQSAEAGVGGIVIIGPDVITGFPIVRRCVAASIGIRSRGHAT